MSATFIYPLDAKQVAEAYFIQFDFTAWIGTNTIASAVVTATDETSGADVTATVTDVGKQALTTAGVNVWVRAGTNNHSYKVSCVATDSAGEIWELTGVLPVITV